MIYIAIEDVFSVGKFRNYLRSAFENQSVRSRIWATVTTRKTPKHNDFGVRKFFAQQFHDGFNSSGQLASGMSRWVIFLVNIVGANFNYYHFGRLVFKTTILNFPN